MPVDEALAIARQIADALEAAHEKGIVHRDLKPANVKVTPEGKVKVLDFGLAKALTRRRVVAGSDALADADGGRDAGRASILGTAAYMSPEQARGKAVDKRADIWAFGAVLYEMLAGQKAFEGETVSDTLAAVLRADIDWSRLPTQHAGRRARRPAPLPRPRPEAPAARHRRRADRSRGPRDEQQRRGRAGRARRAGAASGLAVGRRRSSRPCSSGRSPDGSSFRRRAPPARPVRFEIGAPAGLHGGDLARRTPARDRLARPPARARSRPSRAARDRGSRRRHPAVLVAGQPHDRLRREGQALEGAGRSGLALGHLRAAVGPLGRRRRRRLAARRHDRLQQRQHRRSSRFPRRAAIRSRC